MLSAVVDLLVCPVCRGSVELIERTVVCSAGHRFDVARGGFVSLFSGRTARFESDTAEMLDARERAFAAGWLGGARTAVAEAVGTPAGSGVVVELGAGGGDYLAACVGAGRGIGLDLSAPACRRIARRSPRIGAVRADCWAPLPIGDAVADVVLSVFAPRNPAEAARVLADGGRVVVVTPEAGHGDGLPGRAVAVEPGKLERLDASLAADFRLADRTAVAETVELEPEAAVDVVMMGPSAFHTTRDAVRAAVFADAMKTPTPLAVRAAVSVSVYIRR